MRSLTSALLAVAALSAALPAFAAAPSVVDLDAAERAVGNRADVAQQIGRSIFRTEWPAQVSQVSANELGGHLIVGVRIWGVKFHHPLTQAAFTEQILTLEEQIFAAAPGAEEVDFWASVPLDAGRGAVVSGDLAKPTSATVFSVTVRHGESAVSLRERMTGSHTSVFWDPQWVRSSFEPAA